MDQWLYSISDYCFDDLTNYKQNCYSSIVDGIVFASDVKRCTLSYFASVSSSETMDRWGWQYGIKRLGMVYWTQHARVNQIEFATRSRWTSKNDIHCIADVRQTAIQNAVTVESMVWNVLSLALNYSGVCEIRQLSEAFYFGPAINHLIIILNKRVCLIWH